MNIVVTGGSGKLGQQVIADLQEHGYRVVNADRHPSASCRTIKVDLRDLGQVFGALAGSEAVIHLAAIPAPNSDPPEVVFSNNVISTFNILQAATVLGIKKVVLASSLSALGLAYPFHPVALHYLPIDETHPDLAQDAYGISKIVGENVADGFARRDESLSLVSLRFPLLLTPAEFPTFIPRLQRQIEHGAALLWSYLDTRDAADLIRLALDYTGPGHDVFYAAAPDTFIDRFTLELVHDYYPGVEIRPTKLEGYVSPIDCSHAHAVLGFTPQFGWRNHK